VIAAITHWWQALGALGYRRSGFSDWLSFRDLAFFHAPSQKAGANPVVT
jgi:hypothetical protein